MALHWDLTGIAHRDEVCFHDDGHGGRMMNAVTEVLIWGMMGVDKTEITQANWMEVYARMTLLDALHGPSLVERDTETGEVVKRGVTPEEVRAHIGLHCNVTNKSELQFFKPRVQRFLADARRHAAAWERSLEETD